MKTAKQILIEHDCYQPETGKCEGRIISIDVARFERAMKEYAEQSIERCSEQVELEFTDYEKGNYEHWEDFTSTSGEWFRVRKQSILKVKEELK